MHTETVITVFRVRPAMGKKTNAALKAPKKKTAAAVPEDNVLASPAPGTSGASAARKRYCNYCNGARWVTSCAITIVAVFRRSIG